MSERIDSHAWQSLANGGAFCVQCGVHTSSKLVQLHARCPKTKDIKEALYAQVASCLSRLGTPLKLYIGTETWQEFLCGPIAVESTTRMVEVPLTDLELWVAFYEKMSGEGPFENTEDHTAIWTSDGVAGSEMLVPRNPSQVAEAINLAEIVKQCQRTRAQK